MLTFKNLQDEVLRYWDQPGDTGNFLSTVKDAINDAHAARCEQQRWSFMLWASTQSLTTASGTLTYRLHPMVERLFNICNTTTGRDLIETPPREILEVSPTKHHFHWVEPSPIAAEPSTVDTIGIASSSVSDTTPTVTIHFLNASGDEYTETLTANGTTKVENTFSVSKVLHVSKGGTWLGTMTLTDKDGNTLLTLLTDEDAKCYPQINLLKDPEAADTITYRFYRRPQVLTNDGDIPDIPYPHSRILVWDALMLLASYDEAPIPRFWTVQQTRHENALQNKYLEGQTLGARPRMVRDVAFRG